MNILKLLKNKTIIANRNKKEQEISIDEFISEMGVEFNSDFDYLISRAMDNRPICSGNFKVQALKARYRLAVYHKKFITDFEFEYMTTLTEEYNERYIKRMNSSITERCIHLNINPVILTKTKEKEHETRDNNTRKE